MQHKPGFSWDINKCIYDVADRIYIADLKNNYQTTPYPISEIVLIKSDSIKIILNSRN